MKVHQLMDILSQAKPYAEIYLQDEKTVFDSMSAEIAPETGNVFISFVNWYKELLKDKGYLVREPEFTVDNRWISVDKEIPKMEERVLVKTFGITTIAMRVSAPNESLKFSVVDPITNNLVYDAANHYQIREWRKMPT